MNHNFYLRVRVLMSFALLALPLAAQKPLVSYTFESQKACDDSGTYIGTLENNARIVTMQDGNHTLWLGDENGYMNLGSAMGQGILAQLHENFTFTCNVLVEESDNLLEKDGNFLFCLGNTQSATSPQNYYAVRLKNGVVGFTFRYQGTNYRGSANISIEQGKWQTITYVRNGSSGAFYLNGEKKYSETLSGNGLLTPSQTIDGGVTYGCNYLGLSPWSGNVFLRNGYVDNFLIYDKSLSEEEVLALHQNIATASTQTKAFATTTDRYRLLRSCVRLCEQIRQAEGSNVQADFSEDGEDLFEKAKAVLPSDTASLQQAEALAIKLYQKARLLLTQELIEHAPESGFDLTAAIKNPFFFVSTAMPDSLEGWAGTYQIASVADTVDNACDAYFTSKLKRWTAEQTLSGLPNGAYRIASKALRKDCTRKYLTARTDSSEHKQLLSNEGDWESLLISDTLNTISDTIYVKNGSLKIGFEGDNTKNVAYADEIRLFLLGNIPENYNPHHDKEQAILPDDSNLPKRDDIVNLITRINDSWIARHSTLGDYRWNKAVYMNGNMEAVNYLNDIDTVLAAKYRRYALEWSLYNKWQGSKAPLSEASKWKLRGGVGDYNVLFGDNQICFQTYIELYNSYNADTDENYLIDVNGDGVADKYDMIARSKEVMGYQIATSETRYWWWTDALYMMVPVMSHMYNLTKNDQDGGVAYLAATKRYLDFTRLHMYDEENNLFFRDSTYVYPKHATAHGIPNYWSRAEGWALAGLARALRELPTGEEHYDYLMALYKEGVEALVPWIQTDENGNGYWTQSICDPDIVPGYETSGTALDVYALLIGLRYGWLDAATYYPIALSGWNYLVNVALQGMDSDAPYVGYAQPIGAAATQTTPATSEQDFATGAFLECAVEMARYADMIRSGEKPVGISQEISIPSRSQQIDVYSLDGTLLRKKVSTSSATNGLPKGIYIVGGKKVLVK